MPIVFKEGTVVIGNDSSISFGVYELLPPILTYVSKTDSSITFKLTNPNTEEYRIYFEIDDNTPDLDYRDLAAGATSSNITISGLTASTAYYLFYKCVKGTHDNYTMQSLTQQYNFATTNNTTTTPNIISASRNNVDGFVYVVIKNQDVQSVNMYAGLSSSPTTSFGTWDSFEEKQIQIYSDSSTGTVYARAQASGKNISADASKAYITL